jgi:hypothetical protein
MSAFTDKGTENRMVWDRTSRDFMEVWYSTVTDPESGTGIWVRYTLTAPSDSVGDPYCELWGFVFDPNKGPIFAAKDRFSIDRLGVSNGRDDGAIVRIGNAWLSENHLDGSLTRDGKTFSWSIDFVPARDCFQHLPAALRDRIATRVSTVCSPNLAVPMTGVVQLSDRKIELSEVEGCQSHRWGRRHSQSWTWAHCSKWDEGEGLFEGIAAKAALGPLPAPKTTFVFLDYEGERIAFNDLRSALSARSKYELPEWSFRAHTNKWKITGAARAQPERMVQVTYEDPDGSKRYCANSEVSDLAIQVFEKSGRLWSRRGELVAHGTAHLEFGRESPFTEVPVSF